MASQSAWFDYRLQSGLMAASPTQICDLSRYQEALLDYQDISSLLDPECEKRIVDWVKALTDISYDSISKRYDHWLEADRAHDLYVPAEATAFREKVVIADTRAISDTVLTYLMAAICGRNPMFQLEGLNRASRTPAAVMERVLHQHNRMGAIEAKIAQLFLDANRYGFAPTKNVWSPEANTNIVVNCDPRKTFPDPRARAGDVDAMQFIVFSDHASGSALKRTGLYPKLYQFPALLNNENVVASWKAHRWHKEEGRGWNINRQYESATSVDSGYFRLGKSHITDEAWFVVDGYDIGLPQLGMVWMVATILDERFVIRLQLSPYGREFPCVIGSYGFDQHKSHQQSLYDLLLPLHHIATWLLRSRVDNVQAALNNLIFADPTRVAIHDLINRNPWGLVRTLPGHNPKEGVFIAQIPDVTKGHWNDIAALSDMKQRLSAASDAQQGVPTGDVRSATEIQRLTQLGSQRLGVIARIMSATSIRRLVRMQVSNIQDALRFEGSIKVDDHESNPALAMLADNGFIDFDVSDLQGQIDYLVVDGTLPIEPTRSPETWINVLQTVNQAGLQFEYDTGRMVEEAIRSMGVPDLDQFRIDQKRQAQEGLRPSQQLALLEKLRGQTGVMDPATLQQQVDAGNLVPFSEAP